MCEEVCIALGEEDDPSQAMDHDIKKIARMITDLNELAYNTYKPIVDDICARKAPEAEVEHLLDYMVGICNDDRMRFNDGEIVTGGSGYGWWWTKEYARREAEEH